MSLERISPIANKPEELSPLERFNRLLDSLKAYALGNTGWQELPEVNTRIRGTESVLTRFYVFLPTNSRYSPSILLELGHNLRDPISGKRLTHDPDTNESFGELQHFFVRKNFLKKSSPYYSEKYEQDLQAIEEMFYAYRESIEVSKPSEQNRP